MSLLLHIAMALSTLAPSGGAGASWAQSRPSFDDYRSRYELLSDRNIFLRDRRSRSRRDEAPSRPSSGYRRPEEGFVLTGIVYEEGEFHAYLENTDNSSILRLHAGDQVAQGTIAQIQMDAIEFEQSGRRAWIDIGRRLTGERVTSFSTGGSSSEGSAASQPGSTPLPNPNDPNLTIEQRMRLRRMQELNRK